MHIIIDGYNVIGIDHKDMERARAQLVERLAAYRSRKHHDITVVFDGYKMGMRTRSVSYSGYVKIVFSCLGEKADDFIKKAISSEHREWIVVTADHDIVDRAWSCGSVPVPPDRFMNAIMKCLAVTDDSDGLELENEDSDERLNRKGSAYHLSRKEKAIRRVLKKL
ncbi:MAG TPA: NYN domain-containing protein [Dissulfurispiraceae bacterium]|nr:NYN domain-containing protein [Dissulfurispiraceae bacterium]